MAYRMLLRWHACYHTCVPECVGDSEGVMEGLWDGEAPIDSVCDGVTACVGVHVRDSGGPVTDAVPVGETNGRVSEEVSDGDVVAVRV